MNYFINQLVNVPLYYIKDCNNCYFVREKLIYNVDTKKFSKLRLSNCSSGFTINGKFINVNKIEKIKVTKLSRNL